MSDSPFQTNLIEHRGYTICIKWYYDHDSGPPWEECDGHGPVSDWTSRDKRPGERVLCSDRRSRRYYDYAAAIEAAKRDGWDAPPYKTGTKGERAARAVEADFTFLKRWCDNDWWWCGYQVSIVGLSFEDSLWSIDSDSINEFEAEVVKRAKDWIDNEVTESNRAACADILTV